MNTNIDELTKHKARNAAQSERADRFALTVKPDIDELKEAGLTIHGIAEALNKRRLRTPRGHFWTYRSVFNVCARLDAIASRVELADVFADEFIARLNS